MFLKAAIIFIGCPKLTLLLFLLEPPLWAWWIGVWQHQKITWKENRGFALLHQNFPFRLLNHQASLNPLSFRLTLQVARLPQISAYETAPLLPHSAPPEKWGLNRVPNKLRAFIDWTWPSISQDDFRFDMFIQNSYSIFYSCFFLPWWFPAVCQIRTWVLWKTWTSRPAKFLNDDRLATHPCSGPGILPTKPGIVANRTRDIILRDLRLHRINNIIFEGLSKHWIQSTKNIFPDKLMFFGDYGHPFLEPMYDCVYVYMGGVP